MYLFLMEIQRKKNAYALNCNVVMSIFDNLINKTKEKQKKVLYNNTNKRCFISFDCFLFICNLLDTKQKSDYL